MMNNTPRFVASRRITCLAAALVASCALAAQSTSTPAAEKHDAETLELIPFVVSAEGNSGYHDQNTLIGSRTAKDLLSIPAAVTIINRELLEDLGAINITQAVAYGVSGVTPNAIYDDFNIRGFRVLGNLRNRIRVKSFERQPMYDVERVEVIKGPAAMLLGVNEAFGGAVKLVSRKPTVNFGGQAKATFGNDGYLRGEVNISGPFYKPDDLEVAYRLTLGSTTASPEKEIESRDELFVGGALLTYFGKEKNSSLNGNWFVFEDDSYNDYEDFLDLASTRYAVLNKYSTKSFSPARSKDVFSEVPQMEIRLRFEIKGRLCSPMISCLLCVNLAALRS